MMATAWIIFLLVSTVTNAADIQLLECEPPDMPVLGGYGPIQPYYVPGDRIHYYCDTDTYIGGNFLRICEDTGDWSGDTPVCDTASSFSSFTQSSTADDESEAELAIDGIRSTCSGTSGGAKEQWFGNFTKQGELIRVMLFLPIGPVSYEVVLVKPNGQEVNCGGHVVTTIDRYEWRFHNCPGPNNVGASGVKIRSVSNLPLKICEIAAHVLTSPKCVDPRVRIENGRIRLTRHSASLVCNRGFTRSPDDKLECIREGVWNRKLLYCIERQWEVDSGSNNDREPNSEPNRGNPDRERIEV